MKFLIVGLGNIGSQYINTRHNIGFKILDAFASEFPCYFEDKRYGNIAEMKYKARTLMLLKPSTYVNRSGLAVNYWMKKLKIPIEKILIITDDLSLPFGKVRLKPRGGDAGHNGLASIIQILGHRNFSRLRFGIGNEYLKGQQVDYVLGEWTKQEIDSLPERINICTDIIKSFTTLGVERTMNLFNNV